MLICYAHSPPVCELVSFALAEQNPPDYNWQVCIESSMVPIPQTGEFAEFFVTESFMCAL